MQSSLTKVGQVLIHPSFSFSRGGGVEGKGVGSYQQEKEFILRNVSKLKCHGWNGVSYDLYCFVVHTAFDCGGGDN